MGEYTQYQNGSYNPCVGSKHARHNIHTHTQTYIPTFSCYRVEAQVCCSAWGKGTHESRTTCVYIGIYTHTYSYYRVEAQVCCSACVEGTHVRRTSHFWRTPGR